MIQTPQKQLPKNLTLHVGEEESLLKRADHSSHQTELILAPVKLHRRNIQRRLRESQTSKDGLQFAAPTKVGQRILDTAEFSTVAIDRIDRLSMIRSIISGDEVSITAPAVPSNPQTVEQIRTEIESVTGFHPERVKILQEVPNGLTAPIDADAAEILNAAIGVEQALRQRTSKSVSDVEFVRRATRQIIATDGEVWEKAFPEVDRVSLVGVSSISASHLDLLHAVLKTVPVAVQIHFRRGTGLFLSQRIPQLFDIDKPGAVVFES